MRRIARQPSARFTRRSFFVDDGAIRRARRVLGVRTNAEAVRLALKPESIELP
jgi:Arc/MetJ family transcription regulator